MSLSGGQRVKGIFFFFFFFFNETTWNNGFNFSLVILSVNYLCGRKSGYIVLINQSCFFCPSAFVRFLVILHSQPETEIFLTILGSKEILKQLKTKFVF